MSDLERLINKAFSSGKKGITIWKRIEGGFQANVQNEDSSWTVMMDDVATDALEAAITNAIAFPRGKDPARPYPGEPVEKVKGDILVAECTVWLRSACLYERFEAELISDGEFDELSRRLFKEWDRLPADFKKRVDKDGLSCGSAVGVEFTKEELQWARKWVRSQDEDLA